MILIQLLPFCVLAAAYDSDHFLQTSRTTNEIRVPKMIIRQGKVNLFNLKYRPKNCSHEYNVILIF